MNTKHLRTLYFCGIAFLGSYLGHAKCPTVQGDDYSWIASHRPWITEDGKLWKITVTKPIDQHLLTLATHGFPVTVPLMQKTPPTNLNTKIIPDPKNTKLNAKGIPEVCGYIALTAHSPYPDGKKAIIGTFTLTPPAA